MKKVQTKVRRVELEDVRALKGQGGELDIEKKIVEGDLKVIALPDGTYSQAIGCKSGAA